LTNGDLASEFKAMKTFQADGLLDLMLGCHGSISTRRIASDIAVFMSALLETLCSIQESIHSKLACLINS